MCDHRVPLSESQHIDGAMVGSGAQVVPAVKGREGAVLAFYWVRGHPNTLLFRELRSHWNTKIQQLETRITALEAKKATKK